MEAIKGKRLKCWKAIEEATDNEIKSHAQEKLRYYKTPFKRKQNEKFFLKENKMLTRLNELKCNDEHIPFWKHIKSIRGSKDGTVDIEIKSLRCQYENLFNENQFVNTSVDNDGLEMENEAFAAECEASEELIVNDQIVKMIIEKDLPNNKSPGLSGERMK